jgi:hypothetical protein
MRRDLRFLTGLLLAGAAIDATFVTGPGAAWTNPLFLVGFAAMVIAAALLLASAGRAGYGKLRKEWQLRRGGWTSPEAMRDELPSRIVSVSEPSPLKITLLTPVCNTPGVDVTPFHDHDVTWPADWRFHVSEGRDGVLLVCRKWGRDIPQSVTCIVEDPQGERYEGALHWKQDSVRCVYPVDFPVTAESGSHHVHWTAIGNDLGFDTSDHEAMYEILDFAIRVGPG